MPSGQARDALRGDGGTEGGVPTVWLSSINGGVDFCVAHLQPCKADSAWSMGEMLVATRL